MFVGRNTEKDRSNPDTLPIEVLLSDAERVQLVKDLVTVDNHFTSAIERGRALHRLATFRRYLENA